MNQNGSNNATSATGLQANGDMAHRVGLVKHVASKMKDGMSTILKQSTQRLGIGRDRGTDFWAHFPFSTVVAQSKPWTELLDRTSFSRPASISEATQRIRKNLTYFRVNYFLFIVLVTITLILLNPSSILVMALLGGLWSFLFVLRSGNLEIAGRTYTPREQMIGCSVVTVLVVFFFSSLGSLLFTAATVSCLAIAAHGALRTPDDLFLPDEQPGDQGILGGLLPTAASAMGAKGPNLV